MVPQKGTRNPDPTLYECRALPVELLRICADVSAQGSPRRASPFKAPEPLVWPGGCPACKPCCCRHVLPRRRIAGSGPRERSALSPIAGASSSGRHPGRTGRTIALKRHLRLMRRVRTSRAGSGAGSGSGDSHRGLWSRRCVAVIRSRDHAGGDSRQVGGSFGARASPQPGAQVRASIMPGARNGDGAAGATASRWRGRFGAHRPAAAAFDAIAAMAPQTVCGSRQVSVSRSRRNCRKPGTSPP